MKINIYINWEEQKVYSEEEYREAIVKEVEENLDDWGEEWLEEHYSTWELFNLQESEKLKIEEQMKDELVSYAISERINSEWDIIKVEI